MKTCSSCGQVLPDDAIFCGNCGERLAPQPDPVTEPLSQGAQQSQQGAPTAPPDGFCPNCGEAIYGSVMFCPNCGTKIESSARPKSSHPGMSKKPFLGLAVGVVAILAIGAIGVRAVSGLFTSPERKFVQLQQSLFMDQVMDELETTLDTYQSGKFSTDLTISASVDTPEIDRFLEDSSIGLKLDLNHNSMLAESQFVLMGSPVLNAAATYDKGQFGFSLPEVDENYYVMDLSSMIYNLTGRDVDLSQFALPEISGKEWRSLIQSYLDMVYTVVTKDNVEVRKNENVQLEELSRSFDGTVYTFTPSGDDVEAMLLKIAENLRKDETLRSLILDIVPPEALEATFGENVFGGYNPEEQLDEAILSLSDTLEEEAAYIGDSVELSNFTWTLVTEKKEVRMIRLEDNGQAVVYERDGSESDGVDEVVYLEAYGDRQVLLEHEYSQKSSVSEGSLIVTMPYESSIVLDYEVDKNHRSVLGVYYGTYELSVPDEGLDLSLKVQEGDEGGVDHILSVNNCQSLYYYAPFNNLELTINATDKSSAKKPSGETVDITDYSSVQLEDLFNQISSVLQQDLINNLEPLMYDLYYYF